MQAKQAFSVPANWQSYQNDNQNHFVMPSEDEQPTSNNAAPKKAGSATSPLSNSQNKENLGEVQTNFFQSDDLVPNLPPPSTEEQSVTPKSVRCGSFFAPDFESVVDEDFADVGMELRKSVQESASLVQQIKAVPLFEGYDEDELKIVANYMYKRRVSSGEVIIEIGGPGDAFYAVKSGEFVCTVPDGAGGQKEVRRYNESGCFGELALINRAPRAATVTAVTDGELWALCSLRCSWLRKKRAKQNAELFESVIRSIPIFRDNLNPSLVNRLIDAIEVISLSAGSVICQQGETGDAMYFILEGEVEVVINGTLVKVIRQNGFFGERALILHEGRAATCRTTVKSRLAKLHRDTFNLQIPDNVIDQMKQYMALAYEKCANDDATTDDELSTASVYLEYVARRRSSFN